MITLDQIRGRPTISVREAAQVLGVGRDAAYDAAARGEIPVLRLGRALRVPVPRLLELLGESYRDAEAGQASPATATVRALTKSSIGGDQHGTHPAA